MVYSILNLSYFKTVFITLKFMFLFYDTLSFLVPFAFYLHKCCFFKQLYALAFNTTNSFMICPPNSSFISPITFFIFYFR